MSHFIRNSKVFLIFVSIDEGGFRKDGQNCIYRGNQCSFEGTIPETVDTAHVDIGNINMFDGETAFRPLLEMRVRNTKTL